MLPGPISPRDYAGSGPAGAAISVVHALPGRLRLHVPTRSGAELQRIAAALRTVPAVHSAGANAVTGMILLRFDADALDAATAEDLVRAAALRARLAPPAPRARPGGVAGQAAPRRWPLTRMGPAAARPAAGPRPRSTRVIWPLVHLIFSASPIGVALHAGELLWALAPWMAGRVIRVHGAGRFRAIGGPHRTRRRAEARA